MFHQLADHYGNEKKNLQFSSLALLNGIRSRSLSGSHHGSTIPRCWSAIIHRLSHEAPYSKFTRTIHTQQIYTSTTPHSLITKFQGIFYHGTVIVYRLAFFLPVSTCLTSESFLPGLKEKGVLFVSPIEYHSTC